MPRVQISFVGDVLIHTSVLKRAKSEGDLSFTGKFDSVRDQLDSANLSCANLESLTAGSKYGISGYPRFNAPVELLDGLKNAGFDLLNVANNHMLDKGEDALLDALSNIRDAGLASIGAVRRDQGDASYIQEINGVKIGFLSFTDGSKIKTNLINNSSINHFAGESEPVRMFRRLNPIREKIKILRENAGFVILQLHFGEEYLRLPNSFQRELVAMICETDVDVIVGHH